MTPQEEAQTAAAFEPLISALEGHFGTTYQRNAQGFSVLFWGDDTPPKDIFLLALVAFARAVLRCDSIVCAIILTWMSDGWW